ncbi:PREDICTED: translation initiation factor IF-3, mitochondrial [Gavialis gangeticus]|uniref:translation initiation factor IF-3, mitochondrial n=1 Tax=Gavialis gangeticus TaxID=94835 RepID=UPI00092E4783|nr:PREDICTED: translation initiation factor IF-3, mitochondrial [Gavialis gangeticus]
MAAFCLRKLIHQVTRNETTCLSRSFGGFLKPLIQKTPLASLWATTVGTKQRPVFVPTESFSSGVDANPKPVGKKKVTPTTFGNVGRRIPNKIVHLIDEKGVSLGSMHRRDVIQLMTERELKLVPLNVDAEPPVYGLMTGKQIHEEQIRQREKAKANPVTRPSELKEMRLSSVIAKHDLEIKIKHIQQWIDKKHSVRISVPKKNEDPETTPLLFVKIFEAVSKTATYQSQPRITGNKYVCVLRHMSDKELQKQNMKKVKDNKQSDILKKCGSEAPTSNELH